MRALSTIGLRRAIARDRQAIEHHYDVSNEFYELFLGPTMVYTCAYYRTAENDLDQAQADKLDLVCRKLRLQPGERLLDIGCGWGSLVRWAARHYGVRATGVTLSPAQSRYAEARIRAEALDGLCRVECRDYREIGQHERFDKIAAVGVIEHVGVPNYPDFFRRVHERLEPGGLFLNHGITHERHWQHTPQWDFVTGHVFPNGDLDNVSHMLGVMEDTGWEIRDVEQLREHYSRTCRQWAERLLARREQALRLVPERTYRTWCLYLAASSRYFAEGSIGLYQTVLARADSPAEAQPVTRESIYVPALRAPAPRRHDVNASSPGNLRASKERIGPGLRRDDPPAPANVPVGDERRARIEPRSEPRATAVGPARRSPPRRPRRRRRRNRSGRPRRSL